MGGDPTVCIANVSGSGQKLSLLLMHHIDHTSQKLGLRE